MKRGLLILAVVGACLQLCGCRKQSSASGWIEELKPSLQSITDSGLLRHITILASDEFEGRAPGTRGEQLTLAYLTAQFKQLGMKPGNPNGTFIQEVPMSAIRGTPSAYFVMGGQRTNLACPDEYLAISRLQQEEIKIRDSEMVFVGYGTIAPEYGWDDYKGTDVRGKTLVMLINDPPVPDPADSSRLDETVFKGKAMTYYGRWTYKYEIAAKQGAAAAVLIHETDRAGYPFEVLVGSHAQENIILDGTDGDSVVPVESWITLQTATKLFSMEGTSFDVMKKAAAGKDFKPVALKSRANFVIKNSVRKIRSGNVVAVLEGSDPLLREQCLVYSAHWDHLGKDERLKGDQIYNGARDNASGTAGLLEIAKAYARLDARPKRSILFLSPTSEEKGLLGSRYYAEHPFIPLSRTVADINMDSLNLLGRTRDIVVIGSDPSPMDSIARQVAQWQSRRIEPEFQPEKGLFYRSDSFEFAKRGVPALYTDAGVDLIGKPVEYGKRMRGEYTRRDYHKVTDEVKADWDLSGAVEDLQFFFLVGYRYANH